MSFSFTHLVLAQFVVLWFERPSSVFMFHHGPGAGSACWVEIVEVEDLHRSTSFRKVW